MSVRIKSYKGVIVPMVTPVTKSGNIDQDYAARLINFLFDHNTIPFIMGTTGEAALIPLEQREVLVRILIANRRENIPLIAGVIGLSFSDTISEANKYLNLGVDCLVITLPNYFELTDDQMYDYYNNLSREIYGNIILYNIPKTVHMSIPLHVIEKLSYNKNIIGIKDSEMGEERIKESLSLWSERKDFSHFVGVNAQMVEGLRLRSKGIVPSTANFKPELYYELYQNCINQRFDLAELNLRESAILSKIYQEGKTLGESLAALKVILSTMDLCKPHMLPPLSETGKKFCIDIQEKIKDYKY